MSWQDYEYGPADDNTDYLIDEGWLTPDEAEALREQVTNFKLLSLVLFVLILVMLGIAFL